MTADGGLSITDNVALRVIGAPALQRAGNIIITDSPALDELRRFDALTTADNVLLRSLPALVVVDDVQELASLNITSDNVLSLAGLENLDVVAGDYRVNNCPVTGDLSALAGLQEVRGTFSWNNNQNANLGVVAALTTIGTLDLANTTMTATFPALASLGEARLANVILDGAGALPFPLVTDLPQGLELRTVTAVDGLFALSSVVGDVVIEGASDPDVLVTDLLGGVVFGDFAGRIELRGMGLNDLSSLSTLTSARELVHFGLGFIDLSALAAIETVTDLLVIDSNIVNQADADAFLLGLDPPPAAATVQNNGIPG